MATSIGFIPQFLFKEGRDYRTCANIKNTINRIDRDSPYDKMNQKYKYGVYIALNGFGDRYMYTYVSPISDTLLQKLKKYKNIENIIKECNENKPNNTKHSQHSKGSQHSKRSKGSKGSKRSKKHKKR